MEAPADNENKVGDKDSNWHFTGAGDNFSPAGRQQNISGMVSGCVGAGMSLYAADGDFVFWVSGPGMAVF